MKRYPGIRPFTSEDAALFKGRDQEKRDLFELIVLNNIVVLFGKSGIGKSSLLNAGVCPQLQDRNLHPVFIRLNNTDSSPEEQVYEYLHEHKYIPASLPKGLTLWEYFKQFWYVDLGEVFTPVIIFDQFEELFTLYTPKQRQVFIDEFSDVINGWVPDSVRKKIKSSDDDADKNIDWEKPPQVKFVLSIRSDYLYLLDELSSKIPAILRTRFQLQWLKKSNALEAITLPAAMAGDFGSQPFKYSEEALGEMVNELGKKKVDQLRSDLPESEPEIEAFQLQLLCQHLENKIIREQKPAHFQIKPDFYGGREGIKTILKQFYQGVISRIPSEHQDAVETLMASNLIRNKRRIIMEESAIIADAHIPKAILDQLHEERILRKEARAGHFYYEISHDTLVEPILEKYTLLAQKLEKERALTQAKELEAARLKAVEETRLRKAAEENEKRAKQRTRIAGAALVLTLLLAVLSLLWYNNAQRASKAAIEAQGSASKALKEALEQKTKAEVANNRSISFSKLNDDPKFALQIADYNRMNHPDSEKAASTYKEILNDQRVAFIDSYTHGKFVSAVGFYSYENENILGFYSAAHDGKMMRGVWPHSPKLQQILKKEKEKEGWTDEEFKWWVNYYSLKSQFGNTRQIDFGNVRSFNIEISAVAIFPNDKKDWWVCSYYNHVGFSWGGNEVRKLFSHSKKVTSVAFSPDGQTILSGSDDTTAKLWDLDSEQIIRTFPHKSEVTSVVFSPDGKYILTGAGKTVHLWSFSGRRGNPIKQFLHADKVSSVAFSPDGKTILSGSWDNTAKLWDLNGKEIQTFPHEDKVTSVAFSPDGKYILTGAFDKTVRIWDRSGKEIQRFIHTDAVVTCVAYAPDGKRIIAGGSEGTIEFYKTMDAILEYRNSGFSLQALYDAGVILSAEDLKKVSQKETEQILELDSLNVSQNK